ncbi:hypothetical protein LSH36_205g02022 [Paralvinella palmiformis]|uniref:Uncharacterized protein n=1 Tax=Paralvinella palmiformis TaxID=53620 RepID=A0AAD9N619_9ANNE|nr:hypothetical protein LSH36_205g02022 [Paralvinella palmiformis]
MHLGGSGEQSSSVPSSPVGHAKLIRSATNPFFSIPMSIMKEPPKYDEAVKNKQALVFGGTTNSSTTITTTMSSEKSSTVPSTATSIPTDHVGDVLDILIRNGGAREHTHQLSQSLLLVENKLPDIATIKQASELPPSAAQEPPPTPRETVGGRSLNADGPEHDSTEMASSLCAVSDMLTSNGKSVVSMNYASGMFSDGKSLPPLLLATTMPSSSSISAADTVMSIANRLKLSDRQVYSSGAVMLTTSTVTAITTSASSSTHTQVVQSGSALTASISSPLSNVGSPLDSDSGVGSSVGRKDIPQPLSISPAASNPSSAELPSVLTDSALGEFQPFMDWSDSDLENLLDTPSHDIGEADMCIDADDNKDFFKQMNSVDSSRTDDSDFNTSDMFSVPGISASSSSEGNPSGLFSSLGASNTGTNSLHGLIAPSPGGSGIGVSRGHSVPNLQDLGFTSGSMMETATTASGAANLNGFDWLDVNMQPSGLTPTTIGAPGSSFSADPILTPKAQELLDLFNWEYDLYTPTDMGMPFEKAMEVTTSKS